MHIVGSWRESSCSVPLEPSLNTHRSCRRVFLWTVWAARSERETRRAAAGGGRGERGGSLGGFTRLGFVKKKTTAEKNVDFL